MADKEVRLIDANTLKKAIELFCEDERTNMTAIAYFALLELVDIMPTIEAEPVKHGKWENDAASIPRCSQCSYIPEFNRHIDDYYYSDFCPNCGAKMDVIYQDDKIKAVKVVGWEGENNETN